MRDDEDRPLVDTSNKYFGPCPAPRDETKPDSSPAFRRAENLPDPLALRMWHMIMREVRKTQTSEARMFVVVMVLIIGALVATFIF